MKAKINNEYSKNKEKKKKERRGERKNKLRTNKWMVSPENIILCHTKEAIQAPSSKVVQGENNSFLKAKYSYGSLDEPKSSCVTQSIDYNVIQSAGAKNLIDNGIAFESRDEVPASKTLDQEEVICDNLKEESRQMNCIGYFKVLLYIIDLFMLFLLFPLCIIIVLLLSILFFPFQLCSWSLFKSTRSIMVNEDNDISKQKQRFNDSIESINRKEDPLNRSTYDNDVDEEDSKSDIYSIDLEALSDHKPIQEELNLIPTLDHPFVAIWPLLKHASDLRNPKPLSLLLLMLISIGLLVLTSLLLLVQASFFLVTFLPICSYYFFIKYCIQIDIIERANNTMGVSYMLLWPTIQVFRAVENADSM